MIYILVNSGMSIAFVCFVIGYLFRKRDVNRHRLFMMLGVGFTLLAAIVLVVAIHGYYGGDMARAGFVPVVGKEIVLAHRLIALIATVLMFLMVWTGATRRRALHIQLHRAFVPLYAIVYFSGLLIFTGS
ncbi:MAG: hypothetical protein KDK30_17565 [Leptospiraceae bacterium]|nr:hypothetical protein [Leptospiraceae bacterium]MCB1321999.1 hypothetical protein [Leptospiraceae bacterium]